MVTVICDGCGAAEQTSDVLRDEDVVWPSITTLGWSGSPFATGTHRCPRCAQPDAVPAAAPSASPRSASPGSASPGSASPGSASSGSASPGSASLVSDDAAALLEEACDIRDVGDGARVVVLRSDLDLNRVDQVRPVLMEAAESGRDVVVDMHDAAVIDSAGLGLLVRAYRCTKRRGAGLSLVAPSRFVLTVLHTMHLDGMFPIFEDEQTALTFTDPTDVAVIPVQHSP
ncbi:hypothetical protein GCM10009828_091630 [Actinoplanes couchii]|uniref:Anti-sigma factor antagonist n=2 Tax=Actinoplanes couchii TaxID=403638 RepID=A0ABQ3XGZ6_9ACTN|nr:hypothetical protein Aco03nite_061810 [Actinoplanes couchii]